MATHAQQVLEGASGQRRGVEVALQHLGGLGRVEPGRVVGVAAGDRAFDGAGGEGLGASLGDERVDAAADRVPDHLGQAGNQPERVEHDTRPALARSGP